MHPLDRPHGSKTLKKLGKQVWKYIEYVWPQLERRGGVLDLPPMNRKAKGESNPPISESVLELLLENKDASTYFYPHLEAFENSNQRCSEGEYYSAILRTVRDDPGALARWVDAKTPEDHKMLTCFKDTILAVALGVLIDHPDINPDDIWVVTNHKHIGARSKSQASAYDQHHKQRAQHANTHKIRYAQFLEVQSEYPDATKEACKSLWARKHDKGVATIKRAIRFCEHHEWPNGEPVEPELRWSSPDETAA